MFESRRKTLKGTMEGREIKEGTKPCILANNTFEYRKPNGDRVVILHETEIITYKRDRVVLDSGGWKTVTTKDRMNRFLGCGCVYSEKGVWYYAWSQRGVGQHTPYKDGMEVRNNGVPFKKWISLGEADERRQLAMKKKIKKFVDYVKKELETKDWPVPTGGDCWDCSMFEQANLQQGKRKHGDVTCLKEHMKERYLHGSLLVNAMRWAGYQDVGIHWHWEMKWTDGVVRALNRYLKFQLL